MSYLSKREEITAIIEGVAARHSISMRHMMQDCRRQPTVVARWEAMALVKAHTGTSFPHVGRFFDKDHSTVLYGIARHFGFDAPTGRKSLRGAAAAARAGLKLYGEQLKLEAQLFVQAAEQARIAKIKADPHYAKLMGLSDAA